jgi:hypothetical protein
MNIYVDDNPNPKDKYDLLSMIREGERPSTIEIIPRGNGMIYTLNAVDGGYTVDKRNYNENEGENNMLAGQEFIEDDELFFKLEELLVIHDGGRRKRTKRSKRAKRSSRKRKSTRRRRH